MSDAEKAGMLPRSPRRLSAVLVLDVEESVRSYVVADTDTDASRVLAWIERPGARVDVLEALDALRAALADTREAA